MTTLKQTVQMRGHLVYWNGGWRYRDNDRLVNEEGQRPCVMCDKMPTPEGYDACLGHLPDEVTWACCGHGVEEGYIRWGNDFGHQADALIVAEVANPNLNTTAYARTLWVNPHETAYYIPIPKCGTNSLRATFPDWKPGRGSPDMDGFALIRDPISRWFSGIREFLNNNPNPFSEEFIKAHPTPEIPFQVAWDYMMDLARDGKFEWDDHTKPQADYVYGYDLELVKLDNAAEYVWSRFSRELAWERRRDWTVCRDLIPAIQDHYAEDMALYDAAK